MSKLGARVVALKQQEQATCKQPGERGVQVDGVEQGKNKAVGLFNHMALFSCMMLVAIVAQPPRMRLHESLFDDAKLNGKNVRILVAGATHNFVKNKLRILDSSLCPVACSCCSQGGSQSEQR